MLTVRLPAVLALLASFVLAEERPNIVYVMADELGYYELSCMGHPHIRTPRIDALAREGVRFTQALAGSSLCAPTRCSLMTGKHSGHTSVRSNGGGTPMRAGEATIASVLKARGYATGGFGKWGCGGRGSTGVPEKHGFDVFFGYYDQVHAHSYYPPYLIRNSEEVPLEGNRGGRSGKTYANDVIVAAAKKFIRANKDRPFFCYMPITPPHGMFDIPETDPAWKQYAGEEWPLEARRYAAMVTMIDRQVGEVIDLLKELELDRKTIVFFCGDNGGNDYFRSKDRPRGFHGPNVNPKTGVAFRGQKGNLYEGGLRVPMIARWPGRIAAGRTSDHVWYFPDVMPTLAEIAGAKAPDDSDGLSIVPELVGAKAAGREQRSHEFLYWELGNQTAVRYGHWKGFRRGKNAWELYDLRADITESDNVAGANPEIVAKIAAFAKSAHTPVEVGTFADRADHEKDRKAKWGDAAQPRRGRRGRGRPGPVERLPRDGMLPQSELSVARVSSEATPNGKLAKNAIDGKPRTHWHTRFQGGAVKHPHELVLDLGREREVRGLRYLARQDRGWNGTIAACEVYVSSSLDSFDEPVAKPTFQKLKKAQEVVWAPVKGRYLRLKITSEIGGGPWASIAELGVLGK